MYWGNKKVPKKYRIAHAQDAIPARGQRSKITFTILDDNYFLGCEWASTRECLTMASGRARVFARYLTKINFNTFLIFRGHGKHTCDTFWSRKSVCRPCQASNSHDERSSTCKKSCGHELERHGQEMTRVTYQLLHHIFSTFPIPRFRNLPVFIPCKFPLQFSIKMLIRKSE